MSGPAASRPTLRFGPYQCDLRSGELYKRGEKVHLADQPFRLLAVLLERPGELVTRQELQERLWPGQSSGDFDNGLNIAINKLRAALDDKAETPKYIETIPRRGYRFIGRIESNGAVAPGVLPMPMERIRGFGAPAGASVRKERTGGTGAQAGVPVRIERIPEPGVPAEAPVLLEGEAGIQPSAMEERPSAVRRWWVLGGVAFCALLFALWWFNPLPPPQITRIDQVTSSAAIDRPVKPVGDGGRVYYLAREGDHWNMMQTSLGGGNGQRLEGPAGNATVVDASSTNSALLLGIFDAAKNEEDLWTMPSSGGAARRVGNISASAAAFSPDGSEIAYAHDMGLWVVEADGAKTHKLADLPEAASWLAWSPDGERLRFTLGPLLSNAETSLWEISREGRNLHPVFPGWSRPATECCGSWTPDGRYYVFTSYRGGQGNLWARREGGWRWQRSLPSPFQLTSGPGSPFGGAPSRDGQHIFFYNGVFRQDLERLDPRTGQISPLFTGGRAMHVSFSRDGEWMVYVDPTGGSLIRSRADGVRDRIELAPRAFNATYPRWSPDGKWVVFQGSSLAQPMKVYVVPAEGGQPEPLLESKTDMHDPDWAGDGKSLVVVHELGVHHAERRELLMVDFATRHPEPIPASQGLFASRASPDGRYISATLDEPNQIKLWDVPARQWRVVASGAGLGISVWSPDSRYLYFQDLLAKGQPLARYDLRSRRIEQVAEFSAVLKSGVPRCALSGITPQGEPIIEFRRGAFDLFAAEVKFP